MTKSEMFIKAHEVAAATVHIVGNYSISFSIALKVIIKTSKLPKQINKMALSMIPSMILNAGKTQYHVLVAIYDKTVALNAPKKKSQFNFSNCEQESY